MKVQIVIALCVLGIVSSSPLAKREETAPAAGKQNVFADWQKAFQETLNNLLNGNKNNGSAQKTKRGADIKAAEKAIAALLDNPSSSEIRYAKRQLSKISMTTVATALMNYNNPIILAGELFKIYTQYTGKSADLGTGLLAESISLLTKTNSPAAFATQLVKIAVRFKPKNHLVILNTDGLNKSKFNFMKNPVLQNPNWNSEAVKQNQKPGQKVVQADNGSIEIDDKETPQLALLAESMAKFHIVDDLDDDLE